MSTNCDLRLHAPASSRKKLALVAAILCSCPLCVGSSRKIGPVLVSHSAGYDRSRQNLIVAAINSNIRRRLFGDYIVADWTSAGLRLTSTVTGKLHTIKQTMVERRLGRLAEAEVRAFGQLL